MAKTILTAGLSCPSCIEHLSSALAMQGVANVDVQLDDGVVTVDHEPIVSVGPLITALQATRRPRGRHRDQVGHA